MNFFREIPQDLDDAASVDGASHWYKLLHVYLPLSTPAIATLTLFTAVNHWNSWFDGMILINNINLQPLQTIMRQIVINLDLSQMTKDPAHWHSIQTARCEQRRSSWPRCRSLSSTRSSSATSWPASGLAAVKG